MGGLIQLQSMMMEMLMLLTTTTTSFIIMEINGFKWMVQLLTLVSEEENFGSSELRHKVEAAMTSIEETTINGPKSLGPLEELQLMMMEMPMLLLVG